ncbi:MAG: hypothetical protein U0W40_20930, partial [Acidimicrobiia bacterium]
MTTATDREVLDDLCARFADEIARDDDPRPSAELRAWMDRGAADAGVDEVAAMRARRRAPGRHRRPTRRVAVLVAATVGLLACSLAAAGALPGPLQRGVAGLAHHVGIDLPAPAADRPAPAPDPAPVDPTPVDPTGPVGTLAPPSTLAPTPTLPGPVPPVTTVPVTVPPTPVPPVPTLPGPLLPVPPAPTVVTLLPSGSGTTLLPLPIPDPFTLLP